MRSLDDENDQTTGRTVGKFETLHIQSRKEKVRKKGRGKGREGKRERERR